jgi:CBS domain-containing protein
MRVQDVMTQDVRTIAPEASLKDAAGQLVDHGISGMPVCDAGGRIVGVLSEGDILYKERGRTDPRSRLLARLVNGAAARTARKSAARTVREAMSAPAITIAATSQAAAAARSMVEHGVNRLPVVDWDGLLVGIVTRADLVRAFVRSDKQIASEIREDVLYRVLWIEPGRVEVVVRDGDVTLSGELETSADVAVLERLVEKVPGVVSVRSTVTRRIDAAVAERNGGSR